jgi:hypothetical protein
MSAQGAVKSFCGKNRFLVTFREGTQTSDMINVIMGYQHHINVVK